MKIQALARPNNNQGSVLMATVIIAGILVIVLASYLSLVSNQSKSVARSQNWNHALVVAESGVEEALQMVNKFAGSPALTNWVNTPGADNWSRNGNVYSLKRFMDASKTTYYLVYVTNLDTTLNTEVMIRATGYKVLPAGWAGNTTLTRTVLVHAKIDFLFNVAMAALGSIDLKGNGVASDSFDSGDPNYSTNGLYTKLRRKAGGDIITNNTITNSTFTVGNANVGGHILTGPTGSYSIGPNGSVGDLPWVDANTKGVKPGWARNDLNVVFKDVILPDTLWQTTGAGVAAGFASLGTGGNGIAPDGKYYDHVFNTSLVRDYVVVDNGSIYVGTNIDVRLKVTYSGTYSPSSIYVAGDRTKPGKLKAYLTGAGATLGNEHKTQSGVAENMVFLGLPSMKDLSYKGNGDFTGAIYAPSADFQLAGGGSSTIDFMGSSVTRTIQMNGHYNFHYDERLKLTGPNIGYVATEWKEF